MWVVFKRPFRLAGVIKLFRGCHAEIQLGSDADAEKYVSKDETRLSDPQEVGDKREVGQGKRSDLVALADFIVGGASYKDVVDTFPHKIISNDRGVQALIQAKTKHRSRHCPPIVTCYFGGSGVGKTWTVYDWAEKHGFKDEDIYRHPGGKWFDGYANQPIVFFDEMDKCMETMGFKLFLEALDRYPLSTEVKGAYVKFNSPWIFLAGSIHPGRWVKAGDDDGGNTANQIERRITSCWTRYAQGEEWQKVPMWRPTVIKVEPVATPVVVIDEEDDEDDEIRVLSVEPMVSQPTLIIPEEEESYDMIDCGEMPFY